MTLLQNHGAALTHTHTTRVGGTLIPDDIEALVEYRFKSNTARETQDRKRCFVLERTSKQNIKLSRKFVKEYSDFCDAE